MKEMSVYAVTNLIIRKLESDSRQKSTVKAILADFRNSIGKPLTEAVKVWPILFDVMPESYLSTQGRETAEEAAVYCALQLYALCRQGAVLKVFSDEHYKGSMGKSLSSGRAPDDVQALDRRFAAMTTAASYDEFIYHLRQLINTVRSKNEMTVNFGGLAEDLLWFQRGKSKEVCFKWAKDYYYSSMQNEAEIKEVIDEQ